jgi:hypothetical protein
MIPESYSYIEELFYGRLNMTPFKNEAAARGPRGSGGTGPRSREAAKLLAGVKAENEWC